MIIWLALLCNISRVITLQTKLFSTINEHISLNTIQNDFPILSEEIYPGKKLIYFDNAASSQKPSVVIERMNEFYRTSNANVHRGAHALAMRATEKYEWARSKIQELINAKRREEIIYTKGATEAINIIALSITSQFKSGDEILLSVMEHHSNLVPWQLLAQRTGAILKFIPLNDAMCLDMDAFTKLLSDKTKLVAIAHASNVLGVVNPVEEIIQAAHQVGALVLLDSCQAVPHMPVDVQQLDVDFLVASSHKMCGPTGIGFLYGKYELLDALPPVYGGGEMINRVELQSSTYAHPPSRFEAGTPAIAEAYGFGVACEYLQSIGMNNIELKEKELGKYLYEQLSTVEELELYGPTPKTLESIYPVTSSCHHRTGLVAFNSKSIHATDMAFFLDREGIAVRSGHHCTQPLHEIITKKPLGVSLRASIYFYNTKDEIDVFITKLREVLLLFQQLNP